MEPSEIRARLKAMNDQLRADGFVVEVSIEIMGHTRDGGSHVCGSIRYKPFGAPDRTAINNFFVSPSFEDTLHEMEAACKRIPTGDDYIHSCAPFGIDGAAMLAARHYHRNEILRRIENDRTKKESGW